MNKETLKKNLREIPDFPIPGILFYDVTTLFKNAECLQGMIDELYEMYKDKGITKVVGIESRGFILGGALAARLGAGFIMARKPGKLPAEVVEETYAKEYGTDTIQIHKDAINENDIVLLHDDLLATGGTMAATYRLVKRCGAKQAFVNFVIELKGLNGRKAFTDDKPLNTVNDMSGLIIRIPDSSTYKETFTQLGAAPTPVAWGETYTALDTGLVSAVENIPESIMSASMQEVCKYVNVSNHIIGPTTISVSEQVFQKLTEEQQNILTEAAKEACEFGLNATKDGSDANFAALEGAGLEVVDTDVDSLKAKINYNAYACAKTDVGKQILTSMGVAL